MATPYIVVIGAINTDIGGNTYGEFKSHDSNPAAISRTFGGAGHNIAYNLALMGLPVKFITAFGDDSDEALEHCKSIGLDVSDSMIVPGGRSSIYLYINDNKGEMVAAVSDMEIYDNLTPIYIAGKMDILRAAHAVVLDTNIPQETIEFVVKNCGVPVICDTVSTSKALKLKNCLSGITALKPNRYEAEVLTGISISNGFRGI